MIDNIDLASQNEEAFRQFLITHHNKSLPITGYCYNCNEPTEGNFCVKECREDWEKRKYFETQKKVE